MPGMSRHLSTDSAVNSFNEVRAVMPGMSQKREQVPCGVDGRFNEVRAVMPGMSLPVPSQKILKRYELQ